MNNFEVVKRFIKNLIKDLINHIKIHIFFVEIHIFRIDKLLKFIKNWFEFVTTIRILMTQNFFSRRINDYKLSIKIKINLCIYRIDHFLTLIIVREIKIDMISIIDFIEIKINIVKNRILSSILFKNWRDYELQTSWNSILWKYQSFFS